MVTMAIDHAEPITYQLSYHPVTCAEERLETFKALVYQTFPQYYIPPQEVEAEIKQRQIACFGKALTYQQSVDDEITLEHEPVTASIFDD